MKTRMIVLLSVAVIAILAGYAIAHRFVCRDTRSDPDRLQDVSHLARALDLRPEQIKAMQSLQSRLCGQVEANCARHCTCRKELAAALVAEPFDAARARELRESLCRSYADSEMLALEHIRSLRDILDAPQRARFDRMITKSLARPCGVCTNCGSGCGKAEETRDKGDEKEEGLTRRREEGKDMRNSMINSNDRRRR